MKIYSFHGLAGCVQQHKSRRQGAVVSLFNSAQAHLEGGPWSLVCEDHGSTLSVATLSLARDLASSPSFWCEKCQ